MNWSLPVGRRRARCRSSWSATSTPTTTRSNRADTLAYNDLLAAGMVERSTNNPLGCCLNSALLAVGGGGSIADFDHQVDHVMTRDPDEVTLKSSAVTGLNPVNGFWDSDHAGLFSALNLDD